MYVTTGSAPDDSTHENVYSYNVNADKWTMLPQPGHSFGVLHVLSDQLTIFGGSDPATHRYHKKVTTYNNNTITVGVLIIWICLYKLGVTT